MKTNNIESVEQMLFEARWNHTYDAHRLMRNNNETTAQHMNNSRDTKNEWWKLLEESCIKYDVTPGDVAKLKCAQALRQMMQKKIYDPNRTTISRNEPDDIQATR